MPDLLAAAVEVLRATDAVRDARNGVAHPGEPHDRVLHIDPCTDLAGVAHVYETTSDCSACGGRQYGTEEDLNMALGDLREAVGQVRKPWEARTQEQWDAAVAAVR